MENSHENNGSTDEIENVLVEGEGRYEASIDGTLGVEEEYAIVDPSSLDLVPEFEQVEAAAQAAGLNFEVCGELLASEVEFRTGRCETYAEAHSEVFRIRGQVADVLQSLDRVGATTGTHPWADYREQKKIDLPYYNRLVERMAWVAHRNNTFGLHVHVGVQGADRATAVADALRNYIPQLLAVSASSPFLDDRDTGLASARAMIFSRNFPRGNVPPIFGTWQKYADFVRFLRDAGSIDSYGQMWWGVRLHALHGTVEFRMFDGQPDVADTLALVALANGLVGYLCEAHDAGELETPLPQHLIEENGWRATRWGLEAQLVDLPGSRTSDAREVIGELVDRIAPVAKSRGLEIDAGLDRVRHILANGNSTMRQRAVVADGGDLAAAYREVVAETMGSARSRVN